MEYLGSILEIIKCAGEPMCKYMEYYRKLDENMSALNGKLRDINRRKEDVELKLQSQLRPGTIEKREVRYWLENVTTINGEVRSIEQEVNKRKCLSRARLSKLAETKTQEVDELLQNYFFLENVVIDEALPIGLPLPTQELVGDEDVKEQVWSHLMSNDVGMIGVCGMGGVGKTTVLKVIHNRLLEEAEAKFDKVIWVTVSKEFEIFRLQSCIASAFSDKLLKDEVDITKRVAKLYNALKDKKFMLIFDDVWEVFSLQDVGIPEPSFRNGCKLVLTSRKTNVCRAMGCKVMEVSPLPEQEAIKLFLNTVGDLHDPNIELIVNPIVEQCAGLPLAIVVVAGTLKGVFDISERRNVLNELRTRVDKSADVEEKVFMRLKLSYDRLENNNLQRCFLYCSLYPEDWVIQKDELIEYWILEGFVDMGSRQANYDKGYAILNKLLSNCLLENGGHYGDNAMKMHDLIRDMSLDIASKTPRFMVKAGLQLREIPNEVNWTEDLEKVSLMHNHITEISPGMASPNCPRLSTLLLQSNELSTISKSFFEHMIGLKILNLSNTKITQLPDSIMKLTNLVALLLHGCVLLDNVHSLTRFGALRKLDLNGTIMEVLPDDIDKLVNLIYLDVLYTNIYLKVEQVIKLPKLEVFNGHFYDLQSFNSYVQFMQGQTEVTAYSLFLGPSGGCFPLFDRYVYFGELTGAICGALGEELVLLPTRVQELDIQSCHYLRSLSHISNFSSTIDLQYCILWNCPNIKCVVDFSDLSDTNHSPLERLEQLKLYDLDNLKAIFMVEGVESQSPLPSATFSSLKRFFIRRCDGIEKLLWPQIVQNLIHLEELEVEDCIQIEEIIAKKEDDNEGGKDINNMQFTFPKLKGLKLKNLPKLKSFCCIRGVMVCNFLEEIVITRCPKLQGISLYLPQQENGQLLHPPALRTIKTEAKWWESLEWDNPNAKNVLQPFLLLLAAGNH